MIGSKRTVSVSFVVDDADTEARLEAALCELHAGAPGAAADDPVRVVVCWPPPEPEAMVSMVRELRKQHRSARIVAVLPSRRRNGELRKALRAGADGIVLDRELEHSLSATVAAVAAGQLALPPELRGPLARQALSYREKQVLGMVVMGFTNRQIADKLVLAESTIKTHLSSAFSKLNVRSRAEVAALILDPDEGLGPGILALTEQERARA